MEKMYITIGPIPVPFISECIEQLEKQGWTVRFVTYAGTVAQKIVTPGNENALPSFMVISFKEYEKGKEPKIPELKLGVAPNAKNPS
jgi:hypothetical protein